MSRRIAICLVVWLVLSAGLAAVLPVAAQERVRWRGAVDLSAAGASGELEFFVDFVLGDPVTATIDIPAQGVTGAPLDGVVYSDTRLEFALAAVQAQFRAERDGDSATGTLTQGVELPLRMERVGEAPEPRRRPQTPQAPFPYAAEEVSYVNPVDGNTLAGTLTIPAGDGPHPAALLITGSGPQDRDETIFQHKPFWVIADHLSRNGIAVLRVDDRGVGGSDGARADLTSFDFAADVRAGVDFLGRYAAIDATRIGLIGHSEGGLIAPLVAADNDGVAFVVLLAGPGVSGRELMPEQNAMLLRAAGVSEALVDRHVAAHRAAHAAAIGGDEDELRAAIDALLDLQLAGAPADQAAAARASALPAAMRQLGSSWFRTFLATDPATYLRAVGCPVLALNGTLDLQVSAEQNLPAIAAALRAGGNDDVTTRSLEGLNHLFQHATSGTVAEYGQLEETLSPQVLDLMTRWLRERVGPR